MPFHGNSLNIRDKLEILDEILRQEDIGKVNFTSIGKKFDVDRTTVARISRTRENIWELSQSRNLAQKRKRAFKEQDVDEALYLWIKQQFDEGDRLSMQLLKTKATALAQEMGHEFVPSNSWISRFKERHALRFRPDYSRGSTEEQAKNSQATENFTEYEMNKHDRQFAERLVRAVKNRPCIYNTSHPQYKDKYYVETIWEEIADELDGSADDIRRRWNNLRGSYSKHLGYKPAANGTGDESKQNYRNFYMCRQMEFLRPFMSKCSTPANEVHCPSSRHKAGGESPSDSPGASPSGHHSRSNSPSSMAKSPLPETVHQSQHLVPSSMPIPAILSSAPWDSRILENEWIASQVSHLSAAQRRKMLKPDRNFSEQIVNAVKRWPCLYDHSHPQYKDKYHIETVWEEVAEELGSTADDIRKKWNNIRGSYSKHLAFKPSTNGTTDSNSKPSYKKFYLCKQMEFLRPFMANSSMTEFETHCPIIKQEPEDESLSETMSPAPSPSAHQSRSNSPPPDAASPSPEEYHNVSPQPTTSMRIICPSSEPWNSRYPEEEMMTAQVSYIPSAKRKKMDKPSVKQDQAKMGFVQSSPGQKLEDPDLAWFEGLLPYVRSLTQRKKRQFISETTSLLMRLVDESEEELQQST